MSWSMRKRSKSVQAQALVAATREAADSVAAVGIWVVWLYEGHVLECEWTTHLDAEIAGRVRSGADTAVVIAVAPIRMEAPVDGRVEVLCEYLGTKGIRVHAVHVRALREGELWTSLRGRALAGVVPAVTRPAPTRSHRARVPHRRPQTVGARPRLLITVCAVTATLLCGPYAAGAPPVGQPGLISDPPSAGQPGVSAAPRPAAPATSNGKGPSANTTSPAAIEAIAQPSTSTPPSSEPVSGASPSLPVHGPSAPAQTVRVPDGPGYTEIAAPPADVVRVGAVSIARPEWMPEPIAAHELQWNDYLTDQAATALDQSGLQIPGADQILGTDGGEGVPQPNELTWMQQAALDPQALIPVAADVADTLINTVAAHVDPDPWQPLTQSPVWDKDGLS
ncbi:hypothetical protein [Nocardia sp. CDC160]|uniref:hypothetical protein n=1 Tax=Nocardia sp. CDC160 TaxID=3112166 RepID=UPI002DB967B7|nr:hypothetical protein [Nocardia sp. CDC160]MEC3915499.1 hypothetical protein [Nocardia sp. CDC160]